MASFKFGSNKKTYTIEGMEKEYVIDVGNVDTMKAWRAQLPPVIKAAEALQVGTAEVDDLVGLTRDLVNIVLDGDFEHLWKLSDHNIYAMLSLVADLSRVIREAQGDIGKVYGL